VRLFFQDNGKGDDDNLVIFVAMALVQL